MSRSLLLPALLGLISAFPYRSHAAFLTGEEADRVLGSQLHSPMSFSSPVAVAVDPATHKVFVADRYGHRVLRFASAAALATGASAEVAFGQPDLESRQFGLGADRLSQPMGCWVDAGGRLWVADSANHRVMRFDDSSTAPSGTSAAVVLGQPNAASKVADAEQNRMSNPVAVVVDAVGRLWVADQNNNRVLRFDNAAAKATNANADGVIGQPNYTSTTGGTGAGNLQGPTSLAVYGTDAPGDAIALWIGEGINRRVLRFAGVSFKAAVGASADGVLGPSTFAAGPDQLDSSHFSWVTGMVVDGAGSLWVADQYNNRVMRFDSPRTKPNGSAANGVLGQANFFSGSGGFSASSMNSPLGLAADGGQLWVADSANQRLLRFNDAAAKANGAAAESLLGKLDASDPNVVSATILASPRGIAIDLASGKLFVADRESSRVLRWSSVQALQSGAAAEAVLGQPNFSSNTQATTQAGLRLPSNLAVDTAGRLWVADSGNSRVLKYNNAANLPNGSPADGVLGQGDFVTVQATASNVRLTSAFGVAVDAAGRLWVADGSANRVLRWDTAASKANGAAANGVLGQANFFDNTLGTSASSLYTPYGITVDAAGHLYVAEFSNHRVLRFDTPAATSSGGLADAVFGQGDFATNLAATSPSGLKSPVGVAVDASGRLFVSENGNSRILWFDNAAQKPATGAAADGVLGQTNFSGGTPTSSHRGLSLPYGLAADAAGHIWVADSGNNRVMRFPTLDQPVLDCGFAQSGHFCLLFASAQGRTYQIKTSSDLLSWTTAATLSGAPGITQWIDSAPKATKKYYRVLEP